jgi:hypothetical protein
MNIKFCALLGSTSIASFLTTVALPANAFILETQLNAAPAGVTWEGYTHTFSAPGNIFTGNVVSSDFVNEVFSGQGTDSITNTASGGTISATPTTLTDVTISGINPTVQVDMSPIYSTDGGVTTNSAPPLSLDVTGIDPLDGQYVATKFTSDKGSFILQSEGDGISFDILSNPFTAGSTFTVQGQLLDESVADPSSILFVGSESSFTVGTGTITSSLSPNADGTLVFSQADAVPEPSSILGSIFALGGLVKLTKSVKSLKKSK